VKSRHNSLGLVIQGPLLSIGINGKNFIQGKKSVQNQPLTKFECIDNIEKVINVAKNRFQKIVISTWGTQDLSLINQVREFQDASIALVIVDDPGSRKGKYLGGHEDSLEFFANNKVRQFYGKEQALKVLLQDGIELSFMMRSDQNLNIQLFYNEVLKRKEELSANRFFVPYFLKQVPWAIPDFYMAGRTSTLFELSKLMCSRFEFHSNVHKDLFFKGALVSSPAKIDNLLKFIQRPDNFINLSEINIMRELQSFWIPGSENLFSSLVWRGEKIEYDTRKFLFSDSKSYIAHEPLVLPVKERETRTSDYLYLLKLSSELGLFRSIINQLVNRGKNVTIEKVSRIRKFFNVGKK